MVVLIPAHNEQGQIAETITSLLTQTRPPDRVVVVADNCTDETADIARRLGVEVFVTVGNTAKKAGALNQALGRLLPTLADDDRVLVMDADSALDERFLEAADGRLSRGDVAACGGVFLGKPSGGLVGMFQRNEYARYARDVGRLKGKVLVLTGTATMFRAGTLREVARERGTGRLPGAPGAVYDTRVLTEDNELTLALLHLGHEIVSPQHCRLTTEVMPTWRELWHQRLRWKRGALENLADYGWTPVTRSYWLRQVLSLIGVLVTAWRHVVDRFRAAGATNARWVFNPTADVYAETTPVEVIWPGRQYVDVLGLDGYNWGTYSFLRWRSFSDIFTAQYQRLTALAGDLPVWVCEVSSADPQSDAQRVQVTAPAGQDKGSWWRDALATTTLPKVTTLVLFSINKERDWRVDSTPGALEGLRAGLQAGATPTSTTASPSPTRTVTTTVTATPKTTTTTTTTTTTKATPKPKTTATPKVVAPAARTRPRVVGTPRVGRVLRATRGSWTGCPTTYRYTWKADGRTVRSSVSPRIRLSRALHGKRLTVVVRATRPGAPAGTATSAASGRVRR